MEILKEHQSNALSLKNRLCILRTKWNLSEIEMDEYINKCVEESLLSKEPMHSNTIGNNDDSRVQHKITNKGTKFIAV